MDFDIDAALDEVQEKDEPEIEIETAYKWASRSCACYQLYDETDELKWLLSAESYGNEAIEHAAMAKDNGKTLKTIEAEIDKYKPEGKTEKTSDFDVRRIKLAQLMKDPEEVASALASIVNTLADGGFDVKKSVRNNISKISASELASQKMGGGALVGQAINFIKAALRGQDQQFVTNVLNKLVGKL